MALLTSGAIGGWGSFPKLSVKHRDEIVAFKAVDELKVSGDGVRNGGQHLTPNELHELVKETG